MNVGGYEAVPVLLVNKQRAVESGQDPITDPGLISIVCLAGDSREDDTNL